MGRRFRKRKPFYPPEVYVPERRPHRNKRRLRKKVLRMKRWIERGLNIEPGDLGRGILLCACLFLIMSCYVTGRVARDDLFLARFQAVQLPYADIASAILVGIVIVG